MPTNKTLLGVEMELTEDQKVFLDAVCMYQGYHKQHLYKKWVLSPEGKVDVNGYVSMGGMNLTEIPVKFGRVDGHFYCIGNNLTTLKNCPDYIGGTWFRFDNNPLSNYFRNIKEEDFPHWDNLDWYGVLREYPFLINIGVKYMAKDNWKLILNQFPHLKLYLE
jgi:hypothetical protein